MSLNKLPVLPESHTLYDWADWQSSRDALVSGTPTKYFAKEAWNAIVDELLKALTTAGLSWDNKYTTAQGAKITVAYGKLTAAKFNSVRHNIDRPAPLGWAWAWNKNFRGYIGRENFNGRSTHGKKCDLVYPEYIIELVRKLNLLIEIMRETALISDADSPYLSMTSVQPDFLVRQAAHVETDHLSNIDQSVDLLIRPSSKGESEHKSQSLIESELQEAGIARVESELTIEVLVQAGGQSKQGASVEPELILVPMRVYAQLEHNKCVETSADRLSEFQVESELGSLPSSPADSQATGKSSTQTEVELMESLPLESEAKVSTITESSTQTAPVVTTEGTFNSAIQTQVAVGDSPAAVVNSRCLSSTDVVGTLSTAWYPPIWVNGGLWIRQSHRVDQNEDGELVIT